MIREAEGVRDDRVRRGDQLVDGVPLVVDDDLLRDAVGAEEDGEGRRHRDGARGPERKPGLQRHAPI
jgi:hypothetical protein